MPNSACTVGSTTETAYMPLLPSSISHKVVSNRHAALRESMSEALAYKTVMALIQKKTKTASGLLELQGRQAGIQTAFGHQFVVVALLHQTAMVQHPNHIGFLHGRQAVGNDQGGAPLHGFF